MRRLALIALTACTTTSSTEVLTSEIYASIEAEANGAGTTVVSATLFVGSPLSLDFVDLGGGDSLIVAADGQSKVMVERALLNTVVHHAELDTAAAGTLVEVAFERDVDAGAPRSFATIPAAFELTAPPPVASRASPITLTWSPSGTPDGMSWLAKGDCIEDETGASVGDVGTVTIEAGLIKKRMGASIADQCEVTFTVKRAKAGTLDAHYAQGSIFGTQSRAVTTSSVP